SSVRDVLRQNLQALLRHYTTNPEENRASSAVELAITSGVGRSTIYRILDENDLTAVNIEYVEQIAVAFGLRPWQLLVPALDPIRVPLAIESQEERAYLDGYRAGRQLDQGLEDAAEEDSGSSPDDSKSHPALSTKSKKRKKSSRTRT